MSIRDENIMYFGTTPIHCYVGMEFTAGSKECIIQSIDYIDKTVSVINKATGGVINSAWNPTGKNIYDDQFYVPAQETLLNYCNNCGKLTNIDKIHDNYCEDCASECNNCGEWTDNGQYCENCEEYFYHCRSCGNLVHTDYLYWAFDEGYCSHCYNRYFVRCYNCDTTIYTDDSYYHDGNYYCEDCYSENSYDNEYCHSYDYKPDNIFHGEGELYFGMELEFIYGIDNDKMIVAKSIYDEGEENYYLKEDGSLSCGLELVTHPRTWDSWQEYFDKLPLKKLLGMGCTGASTNTCGIHIHTSKDAWTGEQLFRLFSLIYDEKSYNDLLTISQRTESSLNRYASLELGDIGKNKEEEEQIKDKKNPFHTRYAAINITRETVEFRLFNSNLRLDRVKKNMEFIYALYWYTKKCKVPSWDRFMRYIKKYKEELPNLYSFLLEKRIIEEQDVFTTTTQSVLQAA